ncbi:uncharacterized protein LOC144645125 [Oculina patagonica]
MLLVANRQFSRTALVLIVVCVGLAEAEHAAVKIISPVRNQIFKYGNQSVLFNCTVTQANGSNFQWFLNNTAINPAGKRDTRYWSSFNRTAQHEGEYKCRFGESGIKPATVKVYLAAKPIATFYDTSSPFSVKVNERTTLKCFATGWPIPSITWFRNGRNVAEINQNNQYDLKFKARLSTLGIIATQKKDGGEYICMAKNALGENNATFLVQVEDEPVEPKTTMRAEKPKYTAELGSNATLVCIGDQVKDDPLTFVSWKFNGTRLHNSSGHYVITIDFFTIEQGSTPKVRTNLYILNVRYADSGNYSCIVNSDRVTDEGDTITLEVKAKDKGKRLKTWMIIVISVIAVICFLLLAAVIIVMCWRMMRKKRLLALAQKYDQEDNHVFDNDLFISYSTKDYEWIQESLLTVLDENRIKYIIHSRDFVPGKAWHDNMADSVYNSRKVILVMSANYLSSGFCKDEMRMAMHRDSARDDSSLIVVRIDDIKSCDIPKPLRHRTFIDVTSKEEIATWQRRILEHVRSDNRSESMTSDESVNVSDTRSLLSRLKLKRTKKNNNVGRELENQA